MSALPATQRRARGFTLIEAMMAMVVMVIGLLGLASLQVVAVRANSFGKKMATASQLARDLSDNVMRWDYADSRLTPLATISTGGTSNTAITNKWDMGRNATASYVAEYGELANDANATNSGVLATNYLGLQAANVDSLIYRYWNVWEVDLAGSGAAQGKFVQIIVRWKEPGLGMRQITSSAFHPNPASPLQ